MTSKPVRAITTYRRNLLALVELRELTTLEQTTAPLTDEQRMRLDLLLYGTCYGRRRTDGSLEHIPATEVIVTTRAAAGRFW